MAYTTHGWHIKGSSSEGEPESRARCGGPTLCRKCSMEASEYTNRVEAQTQANETPVVRFDPQTEARQIVLDYVSNNALDRTDGENLIGLKDVYVVWFSKTLQNWKALVSTTLIDGRYYEVTHNGDKQETYLDVYVKVHNEAIRLKKA